MLENLQKRNDARAEGATPPKLTGPQKGGAIGAALAVILAGVYAVEGGYVNDPADNGGATNYGITEKVARQNGYLGDMRQFPKHCYDVMTTCADDIYTRQYVVNPGYYPMLAIEPAVAQELVDTGVNMGPRWPSTWFQASINVLCSETLETDGKVGPATLKAYQNCQQRLGDRKLCVMMLNSLDGAQERRYRAIVARNPSQKKFLRGWLRYRIGNVDRSKCGTGRL